MEMKRFEINEIENYIVNGRISGKRNYIPLFWTGASLEVKTNATEMWAEIECKWFDGESYVRVEVDGVTFIRQILNDGINNVCIFKGTDTDVKNVRIFRETQASKTVVKINAITCNGEFLPLEKKPVIEFVGDSVTSGEGLIGGKCHKFWAPYIFSSNGNYAIKTADALNMNYSILSQSGWGIYCSFNNNINSNLPKYYEFVAGVALNDTLKELGASDLYDFENNPVAYTIINLGANDMGAFRFPEWTSPDGVVYKQRQNEDGTFNKEDVKKVYDAAYDFCKKIRKNRPNTIVVWCYNMLGGELNQTIIDVVNDFSKDTQDKNIYLCELPRLQSELRMAHNHPGVIAHANFSEAVVKRIKEIMKEKGE